MRARGEQVNGVLRSGRRPRRDRLGHGNGVSRLLLSTLISVAGQPVPVQEWFIGSWGFIDYGERPPAGST
ncbi:MAG: hypothetical protein FJW80_08475 [Actinobacteria bacterium]|nr:hypothetical protein [Actinomycetota bacterium]